VSAPRPMIRLKFERLQRGLSQAALARLSNVSQSTICWIELGRWVADAKELDALARALDVPTSVLLKPVSSQDNQTEAEA
jgi:transcriptional regulator with XRE-family HTH domain